LQKVRCRQREKISFPAQFTNLLSNPGYLISLGCAQRAIFRGPLGINPCLFDPATSECWLNPKALRGFQNGQSFALAEGDGLSFLLRRESAALSGHGVHSPLGRRLSDLSIQQGQPHGFQHLQEQGADFLLTVKANQRTLHR
jgi:hypothetical protein